MTNQDDDQEEHAPDEDDTPSEDPEPREGEAPPPSLEAEETAEDDLEEAAIEEIQDAEEVASIHEPEPSPEQASKPLTPGTRARDAVAEIREEAAIERDGTHKIEPQEPRARTIPHGDELAEDLGLDPEEPVTRIPPIDEDQARVLDLSTIREGLAYVRILQDEATSRYHYEVIEPQLDDEQRDAIEFLRETLVQTLEGKTNEDPGSWRPRLQDAIEDAIHTHGLDLTDTGRQRVHYYLERDLLGYGPIDVMMHDPMIEDISCDGPGIPLYIFHREHGSTRTNVLYDDEQGLDAFVRRLAQRAGKHISIAEPILDATLPDTSRLQATLSREVTTRGSSFTIRRFRADPLTIPDLIRLGTLNARMAAWLWMAMEAGAPMLVAGGTASGKTTTMSGLCQFIPPAKKVVTIEDTREISLERENWIASLTRSGAFGDDEGSIDMFGLLRAALRQRPEYLVVGEVRGSEAQTLFQAMATGHATYSTLHADSVKSAVYRLENPPIDVPRMMLQTLDALAVQAQARVEGRMVRRVKSITEITGIDDATGDILTNKVYDWDASTDEFRYLGRSQVLDEWRRRENMSLSEVQEEWNNRALVLSWMAGQGIRHITDVSDVAATYNARPERVLEHVEEDIEEAPVEEAMDP